MKIINLIKRNLLGFIVGIILTTSITTVALSISSKNVSYNGEKSNVQDAIDDLYKKVNNSMAVEKFCKLKSGTALTVGSMYECNPGDNVKRNFYILSINNTNNTVDLILDRNITQGTSTKTMNWNDAIVYFDSGDGLAIKNSWTKVIKVDLPSAQAIADAAGITGWDYNTATENNWSYLGVNSQSDTSQRSNYNWLYNYTRECSSYGCASGTSLSSPEAYGYWTKNLIQNDSSRAWCVFRNGYLYSGTMSYNTHRGIRPVITVLKFNLYSE